MNEAAAKAALRPFGITPTALKQVTKQLDRAVWQVTTAGEQYALKCTRLCDRVAKIGAVGKYLRQRGVPVVTAMPTAAGHLFVKQGKLCFLLFPWVGGVRPVYEDRAMTRPMATLLAQFHEESRGYVATGGPIDTRLTGGWHSLSRKLNEVRKEAGRRDDAFSRLFRVYLPWLAARISWVEEQIARNAGHASLITETRRSPLLVHGDYSAVNLLADGSGNLTIIDLDDVAIALPVWEIARFIAWMNHDSLGWSGERFEVVLDAYRQVRPISAAEEELLRIDLVYPRQAVSLAREHYCGSPATDLADRFAQCITTDSDILRYLGITI